MSCAQASATFPIGFWGHSADGSQPSTIVSPPEELPDDQGPELFLRVKLRGISGGILLASVKGAKFSVSCTTMLFVALLAGGRILAPRPAVLPLFARIRMTSPTPSLTLLVISGGATLREGEGALRRCGSSNRGILDSTCFDCAFPRNNAGRASLV